jgi:TonB family protein
MSNRFRNLLTTLTLAFCAVLSATAQGQQSPAELLADAASKIGIDPKQAPPFHLKAHFDIFNTEGKPDGSGTFEEFSDGKDRVVTHTTYRDKEYSVWNTPSTFTSGQPFVQAFFERELLAAFTRPIPSRQALDGLDFKEKSNKFGSVTLDCVETIRKLTPIQSGAISQYPIPWRDDKTTYCVSPDQHLLRISESFPGLNFVYNQFETFAGRPVPHTIALSLSRVLRGKFVIDSLEAWTPDDAVFVPPPDRSPQAPPDVVSGAVIAGSVLSKTTPMYPSWAKANHIAGSVVLAATITPEGTISDVQVVTSPDQSLTTASLDAVKSWKYKPYLLDGKPVAVDTLVTVTFSFGSY